MSRKLSRIWKLSICILLLIPAGGMLVWMALWVWPRPTVEDFHATQHRQNILILLLSGDLGFHGATRKAALELVDQGFDLVAVDSRRWFHGHDNLGKDSDRLGDLITSQMRRTGDQQLILSGISFGADILPFAQPLLPHDLQTQIKGYALVVPSTEAYFETNWQEHLEWGGHTRSTLPPLLALPQDQIACVYGVEEDDSACPVLDENGAHSLGLPGGHLLNGKYAPVVTFLANALGSQAARSD